MAITGPAFYDNKGNFHKTADEATISDLATMLGRVGDGESLAPGIAKTLFENRGQIETIFREHDHITCKNQEQVKVYKAKAVFQA